MNFHNFTDKNNISWVLVQSREGDGPNLEAKNKIWALRKETPKKYLGFEFSLLSKV